MIVFLKNQSNTGGNTAQKSTNAKGSNKMKTERKESSKTAEIVALHRALESQKPESERICYDPYAICFISQETLELFSDPQKAKALDEKYERLFRGATYSTRARVRFFDDFVKKSIDEELEQLVILGAGYDTRAYRGLKA